jgi:hypothetical protein
MVPSSADEVNGWAFGALEYQVFNMKKAYPKQINGLYTEISPLGASFALLGSCMGAIMMPLLKNTYELPTHYDDSTSFEDELSQVNGLSIILFTLEPSFQNNGVSINFCLNPYYELNGLHITALATKNYVLNGIALTGMSNDIYKLNGVAISGLVNKSYHAKGLQIGLINLAKNMTGVQIGLWNKIGDRSLPFINFSF